MVSDEEEQVVVQGCQKLVLIFPTAVRDKANNTSLKGSVHVMGADEACYFMYVWLPVILCVGQFQDFIFFFF